MVVEQNEELKSTLSLPVSIDLLQHYVQLAGYTQVRARAELDILRCLSVPFQLAAGQQHREQRLQGHPVEPRGARFLKRQEGRLLPHEPIGVESLRLRPVPLVQVQPAARHEDELARAHLAPLPVPTTQLPGFRALARDAVQRRGEPHGLADDAVQVAQALDGPVAEPLAAEGAARLEDLLARARLHLRLPGQPVQQQRAERAQVDVYLDEEAAEPLDQPVLVGRRLGHPVEHVVGPPPALQQPAHERPQRAVQSPGHEAQAQPRGQARGQQAGGLAQAARPAGPEDAREAPHEARGGVALAARAELAQAQV